MAGQQGQPKHGLGWPDGRLGGLGPPGSTTPEFQYRDISTPRAHHQVYESVLSYSLSVISKVPSAFVLTCSPLAANISSMFL